MNLLPLCDDFLTALADPEQGDALYLLHTSDAPLRKAEGIGLAAQTDRVEFARLHREISLRGQGVLATFSRPRPIHATSEVGNDESIGWFEVTDTRDQHTVILALGVKTVNGAPRIGWCTLAAGVENWTYRAGLLQSLADYPWMDLPELTPARALVDASYFRRYRPTPVKFNTLPDARFSCNMSTACCKHDYEITLPPQAQLIVDAMPWEAVHAPLSGTQLPVRSDGKLQLKTLNETCRFLNPQGQCYIHKTLGQQPFGACAVFPFSFARTPEGIAVGLSPICGSARLGLGIAPEDRQDDLRERLVHAQPRHTEKFCLTPDSPIEWQRFRDLEKALCEILATTQIPMRRRLYVGTRLLGTLTNNEPIDIDRWVAEPFVSVTEKLREAIRDMLSKVLAWDRTALRGLPADLPARLFDLEVEEPAVLARVLQNTLFCKVYSYPFDMTTAHNFLIVLYLLTLVMQAASGPLLPNALWQELGSLGVHGLLKSVLHDGVPEGFRALFGTAEFGLWMLSA
jgi:hypothetical protein